MLVLGRPPAFKVRKKVAAGSDHHSDTSTEGDSLLTSPISPSGDTSEAGDFVSASNIVTITHDSASMDEERHGSSQRHSGHHTGPHPCDGNDRGGDDFGMKGAPPRPSTYDSSTRSATDSTTGQACVLGDPALWELVTAFQDGEKASDFWNGDVAATEGHLSLMSAKHVEADPLSYSHLAMNRAAKEGRMDVVRWLHDYTDVPQVPSAIDSAAAGGHLEVSALYHSNNIQSKHRSNRWTNNCTTVSRIADCVQDSSMILIIFNINHI